MLKFVFPLIAGIALSVPAIAQDPYHIRVGIVSMTFAPDRLMVECSASQQKGRAYGLRYG